MIKDITKYYSDIDFGQQFYTKEEAEDFEKTYKPFYELGDEADIKWDSMRVHPEVYEKYVDSIAEEYFDRAKSELDKWLSDEKNTKILCNPKVVDRLRNIKFNLEDIRYADDIFRGSQKWHIIGDLFGTIYCIMKRY